MPEKKIKIFLVDDHKIFVEGVANLLGDINDIEILGWAYNGEETLQFFKNTEADILITDIQMPGMSGIELSKKVKEEYPNIKVIGLSMLDKKEVIHDLLRTGAEGYLLKDIEKSELLNAIYKVCDGEYYYSSQVAQVIMRSVEEKDLLTPREKEIIKLISEENTNAQMADKLFISEHTVESHRKNIFRKTGAKSIVGIVKFAYDSKII